MLRLSGLGRVEVGAKHAPRLTGDRQMSININERGLAEIREILSARHKSWVGMNPADIDSAAVFAYADDAENDESAMFEIRASHSVSGNPETFYISDIGIDA